jgi:hypothetical protein
MPTMPKYSTRAKRALATMLAAGALAAVPAFAVQDYGTAKYRVLSAPDCVDAANMVPEFASAPQNATYMRVQHIGDPGTPELLGEVANAVTWNVGELTGLSPPVESYPHSQRGYRDLGPPNPASAFQLWCRSAGFLINTRQFSHTVPLQLEGPSVSVARDLVPAPAVFTNGTSELTIDAYVRVPLVEFAAPPIVEGTVQVSFVYYARDVTTGTTFAHVITLFDNRSPGVNGTGGEAVSADAYTAFVVSPLSPTLYDGTPTQYASASPYSDRMHFNAPWAGSSFFRVHVPYAKFAAMLRRLRQESLPDISVRPEDYRVTLFGLLGEVFPGTGAGHEVALGASVSELRLSEAYDDATTVPVVEYYNAGFDHYFMSARPADIGALDSGRFAGWTRTGLEFDAYPSFVSGASPVCRFYLPPAVGDSHFFSASTAECAEVSARFPAFILEDWAVMYLLLPDPVSGACPTGSTRVFRFWNGRRDSNHRYTADAAARQRMLAAGWISEGYGDEGVAMCSPAN